MVVEESIHVIFDESNNSLQERESFDDDLGLETSMGKLQIEDRRQQEEIVEDPKKEESPLALPSPQQVQGESSQDLPKDWKFVINHPQDQIIGFSKCMHSEFEMSMMRELNFFLGLQIKQLKEGTFINQAKYIRDLLKRFNIEEAKTMKTPMSSSIKLDKDEKRLDFILSHLVSASFSCVFLPFSVIWMAPKQETGTSRAQGKCPTKPSQPEQMEARRKARYDIVLFSSVEDYQLCKQKFAQRKVVPGRSTNFSQLYHFGFEGLFSRMGWLPVVTISELIFPTLVRAFYSRVTYGLGEPVMSTVRGVEIKLSLESIWRILDIPSVGL
ncbi:hypothetical protein CK203_109077 [Vitis vinifera]|uniref:Reverse transcriptase Ty1/copia-type domain-containing protein n=1 Tax=Vitis vinifera TaxID=29760 RepID=A0A438CYY4_VITVI|nr:hypothetical protein CK203_109077 [Vitis vinifera]